MTSIASFLTKIISDCFLAVACIVMLVLMWLALTSLLRYAIQQGRAAVLGLFNEAREARFYSQVSVASTAGLFVVSVISNLLLPHYSMGTLLYYFLVGCFPVAVIQLTRRFANARLMHRVLRARLFGANALRGAYFLPRRFWRFVLRAPAAIARGVEGVWFGLNIAVFRVLIHPGPFQLVRGLGLGRLWVRLRLFNADVNELLGEVPFVGNVMQRTHIAALSLDREATLRILMSGLAEMVGFQVVIPPNPNISQFLVSTAVMLAPDSGFGTFIKAYVSTHGYDSFEMGRLSYQRRLVRTQYVFAVRTLCNGVINPFGFAVGFCFAVNYCSKQAERYGKEYSARVNAAWRGLVGELAAVLPIETGRNVLTDSVTYLKGRALSNVIQGCWEGREPGPDVEDLQWPCDGFGPYSDWRVGREHYNYRDYYNPHSIKFLPESAFAATLTYWVIQSMCDHAVINLEAGEMDDADKAAFREEINRRVGERSTEGGFRWFNRPLGVPRDFVFSRLMPDSISRRFFRVDQRAVFSARVLTTPEPPAEIESLLRAEGVPARHAPKFAKMLWQAHYDGNQAIKEQQARYESNPPGWLKDAVHRANKSMHWPKEDKRITIKIGGKSEVINLSALRSLIKGDKIGNLNTFSVDVFGYHNPKFNADPRVTLVDGAAFHRLREERSRPKRDKVEVDSPVDLTLVGEIKELRDKMLGERNDASALSVAKEIVSKCAELRASTRRDLSSTDCDPHVASAVNSIRRNLPTVDGLMAARSRRQEVEKAVAVSEGEEKYWDNFGVDVGELKDSSRSKPAKRKLITSNRISKGLSGGVVSSKTRQAVRLRKSRGGGGAQVLGRSYGSDAVLAGPGDFDDVMEHFDSDGDSEAAAAPEDDSIWVSSGAAADVERRARRRVRHESLDDFDHLSEVEGGSSSTLCSSGWSRIPVETVIEEGAIKVGDTKITMEAYVGSPVRGLSEHPNGVGRIEVRRVMNGEPIVATAYAVRLEHAIVFPVDTLFPKEFLLNPRRSALVKFFDNAEYTAVINCFNHSPPTVHLSDSVIRKGEFDLEDVRVCGAHATVGLVFIHEETLLRQWAKPMQSTRSRPALSESRTHTGWLSKCPSREQRKIQSYPAVVEHVSGRIWRHNVNTDVGDCGSPILVNNVVSGIHMFSTSQDGSGVSSNYFITLRKADDLTSRKSLNAQADVPASELVE